MAITPEGYIKLVHFEVNKENQITFDDGVAQVNYFRNTLSGIEENDFTYMRKEQKIRFPALIDTIEQYNYLILQNLPYNYKYFFYYITNMEYVNDNMTDIYIKLDVFQTYQFDFYYYNSFIEREHVNSDTVGSNTVPEGLETGDYYVNTYEYYDNFDDMILVVTASKPVDATSQYPNDVGIPVSSLNGITTYGKIYVCGNGLGTLNSLLLAFSNNAHSGGTESITNMYFVPKKCINMEDISLVPNPDLIYEYSSNYPMIYSYNISKPTTIDGYTPKNKKLLTFPYCFLVGSNNNGSSNIYKYEKFSSSNCQFDFSCIPTPGASIKMTPYMYTENNGYDEEEGLIAGKFPYMNWATQSYNDWLSRNSLNLTGQFFVGGIQTVAGVYTGEPLTTMDGLSKVFNVSKQMYEHKMIPDSSRGNINGADINTASDQNGFYFYKKSIKAEFARIIDDFFSKFGYKVNRIKQPNIYGRKNWNYVKTVDAIVEADNVPEKYLEEYRQMLNSGITFWHDPATFLDYSQSNNII